VIDLAYALLTQKGDRDYVVGPVSNRPGSGYLWHYWIPWLAILDREHLRLRQLDAVVKEGGRFVFPLEFRWECIRWMSQFAQDRSTEFLTPHIPLAVLDAARRARAIILLFFGHEGRSLSVPHNKGEELSVYDLIFEFVRLSELPPGAVWFINGNLAGQPEYLSWKRKRLGREDGPDVFETRFVEHFSHLAQATCREDERGFETRVDWEAVKNADGTFTHQRTHLVVQRTTRDVGSNVAHPDRLTNVPSKLFLCMNRMPRRHRRIIVCHLLRRGFLERSLVSFRDDNPKPIKLGELEMEDAWQELQKREPLTIDREQPLDFEPYYRNNSAAVNPGEVWPYLQSCFSIVTETQFTNEVLFVSEKIWKPIRNGHTFLVVGTPGTLSYLRQLGFQTFMPLIDERYDSIVDDGQRMQALFAVIDVLGKLDDNQRTALLKGAEPVLRHNRCHLRQLSSPMASLLSEIDVRLNCSE
jgi:hypothetical protein